MLDPEFLTNGIVLSVCEISNYKAILNIER